MNEKSAKPSLIKRIFAVNEVTILIALIAIIVITTVGNSNFMSMANITSLLRAISITFVGSVGMMFVISTGVFDLSVGSTYGFAGIITGMLIVNGTPWGIALMIGVIVGAVIGFANGIIITKLNIPPLITTLGMQYIVKGMTNVITQGKPVTGFPDSFNFIGGGSVGEVPVPVFFAAILFVLAFVAYKYSTFGRKLLAVGGNKETARLCGINVVAIQIIAFVIAGATAALVGILTAARLSSAQAAAGTGIEMTYIASVVIGGTSLSGGNSSTVGTLIGVGIMETLTVMTTLLHIDTYFQRIVVGIIIIVAVGIDVARHKRLARG